MSAYSTNAHTHTLQAYICPDLSSDLQDDFTWVFVGTWPQSLLFLIFLVMNISDASVPQIEKVIIDKVIPLSF